MTQWQNLGLGVGACVHHQSRSDEKPSHARSVAVFLFLEFAFGRTMKRISMPRVEPDDTLTSSAQWTDGALPVSRRSIGPSKRFPSPWVWCCTPKRSTHCFHCAGACVDGIESTTLRPRAVCHLKQGARQSCFELPARPRGNHKPPCLREHPVQRSPATRREALALAMGRQMNGCDDGG